MSTSSFEDLLVWKKSIECVKLLYSIINSFPDEEKFALSSQMRRSVVSIPSNIAEGHCRQSKKEFIQFLYIARGSAAELKTQLAIAEMLGYVGTPKKDSATDTLIEIDKMICSLIRYLSKK